MDPKYRQIKITNNTIKTKVMNLKGIEELLRQLGYVLENGEAYTLADDHFGDFIEGEPAINYRKRLAEAKLEGPQAYQK